MRHKNSFTLEVELQINEVTCPGVWLCPYGRLSLEVYMLDTCVQTDRIKPLFPLNFNEQYLFHKTFDGSFHSSHLKGVFDDEYVYMELVQWECDGFYGGVLASFRCPLEELIEFPSMGNVEHCKCNVLELLMQPTKSFPGILSPKIEISTTTSIKESLCSLTNLNATNVTTEQDTSKKRTPSPSKKVLGQLRQHTSCDSVQRQRRVCHSSIYHKSRKCFPKVPSAKPIFAYRRPDSSLIMRQIQGLGPRNCRYENCSDAYSAVSNVFRDRMIPSMGDLLQDEECGICDKDFLAKPTVKKMDLSSIFSSNYSSKKCYSTSADTSSCYYPKYRSCTCGHGHDMDVCSTCSKYMHYFDYNCCYC